MPKSKFMQSSFVSGELSPLLKGRVDLDQYYQGMETAENVLIVPQGGLKRRAGTQHVDVAEKIFQPFMSAGVGQLFSFNITTGLPIVGSTYTNNSSTFTIISFTGSGLPYTVYAERTVGTNDPTASGTLVKTVSTPNLVYSAFTTFTATMPRGGTVANINDFNPATVGLTTTNIGVLGTTGQSAPDDEYIVAAYNILGTTNLGKFVDVKNIKLSGTGSGVFKIQASTDNVSWFTALNMTVTAVEQSVRIRLSDKFDYKYFRIVRVGDTGDLGTLRIQLSEFNILYPTAIASDVKTFDFSIETDRHYLCVVTGGSETTPSYGNMSIYRVTDQTFNFVPVAYLPLPFRSSEVAAIRDVQTENVMLMFHEDHAPIRIINTSGNVFTIDEIPFLNVPQYDYNDSLSPTPTNEIQVLTLTGASWATGDRFQIDVEGILSKNITYAGDSGTAEQNSTVANIQRNLQEMPIFGDTGVAVARTGAKQYTITISGESTKPFELFSGFVTLGNAADTLAFTQSQVGVARKEDVWSDNRGYPKTAAFYSGRLWLGGTKSKLQSLFASRSGSFFDFYTEEGDADEGLFITISSRQLTEIIDINPDRGLQVFTAGAEFVVNGSTPADITIQAQTQHGAATLEVKSVDGATLFVDQNGRTLRSYLYNYNEDAYNSTDISVLSSQLIDNPADLGILTGSLSEDANWVFIVNQDGTSAILNTLRSQDINGFTKWINGDTNTVYPLKTVSVSVVKNDLFLVNKRTTDTTTTYTVEKWDFDYLMDSSVKLESSTSIIGNNLFLATNHLNGETVSVVARGTPLPKRVVETDGSSGYIVLTNGEKSFILEQDPATGVIDVEVGYNFIPKIKSMPLNTNSQAIAGQNQMRQKKITRINLRVYKSSGVYIDDNPVAIRQFGSAADSPLNENLPEQTGVIQGENSGNGWNIEVQPIITVPEPTPFHIQAIEYEVESS
tara:strand:- start:882 stop:3743 length:2862 start_codon:yes stop_codon:yes gene_type:complete